MFAAIAPRYDLLNHLLSLNMDRIWRKRAARELHLAAGDRVLDICTGSGDLAFCLGSYSPRLVVGADFCLPMLVLAAKKAKRKSLGSPVWIQADALRLPFADASFEVACVAFGVRNFERLDTGLLEMRRVLTPGGRLAILEFGEPDVPVLGKLYLFYFRRVLPLLGALISGYRGPYSYLPASVKGFPSPCAFERQLMVAGFATVRRMPLALGAVNLYLATAGGERSSPQHRHGPSPLVTG